jgi:L-amino acid N-acyltransferase YncA/2-polyprenyl-3-methyl-5-hydroxy-6-metoxy-1,4-benzoquinol methylase
MNKNQAEDPAEEVIDRYSGLARAAQAGQRIIEPGAGCLGTAAYEDTGDLPEGALRASLGCGNPVAVADLHPGELVLDLGSGGGIDVLLSARRVAPGGKAYGLDGSSDMLALARDNAAAAGVTNVEFLPGRIEAIPLPAASVDVVISNCVINLSADQPRVLAEAFRVLRPGGRLGITDIFGEEAEYRRHLLAAGFSGIAITPASEPPPGLRSAIIRATRPAAPAGVLIRPMNPADAGAVLAIYQAGLDTGDASFETAAPDWDAFDGARLPQHRHVATSTAGEVLGWAAVGAVSERCVYAGVVEHSIYIDPGARGRGVGAALLAALIGSAESAGIWTIQSGIFPENAASLRLHEQAGFRVVGTRERIGRHHGRWRDVVFLERRSSTAGTT